MRVRRRVIEFTIEERMDSNHMPISLELEKEEERRWEKGEEEKLYNKERDRNVIYRGKERVQGQNRGNRQKKNERRKKK